MIENQLNELIAALNANTAALRDVLAKAGSPAIAAEAGSPVTEAPAPVEPKPAKVKKEKLTVVEPEPAAEEPAAAAEPEPADDLDTTEAISEETRSPEELHLAIRETVKPKLLADNAIQKNTKERWEKIRADHGIRVLAEATDDQLPSILAAVMAL